MSVDRYFSSRERRELGLFDFVMMQIAHDQMVAAPMGENFTNTVFVGHEASLPLRSSA
jgi:hypothetical protein